MRLRLMKGTTNPCGLNKDQETRQPARTAPLIHTHLHAVLVADLKSHLSGDDLCPDERYEGFLVCLLFGLQINSQAKVLHSMIQQYIEAST